MLDIDFLPPSFKQRAAVRQTQAWRGLVAALFAAGLGSAAVIQQRMHSQAKADLAAAVEPFQAAHAETARLAQLQLQVEQVKTKAELYTYLRHPWPRSLVLTAIAAAVPEDVTLTDLRILRDVNGIVQYRDARPARPGEAPVVKLEPAQADLQRLRDEYDKAKVVVVLTGAVHDTAAVNRQLDALTATGLFSSAEVSSIETMPSDAQRLSRFTMRLWLRPGYGQPGGPAGEEQTPPATVIATGGKP